MSDEDALLAAVAAAPADDLPRLVYADWLDEHGRPERAEFVRVQCELGRVPGCLTPSVGVWAATAEPRPCRESRPRRGKGPAPWCEPCKRRGYLLGREVALHGGAEARRWRLLPWGVSGQADWRRGFLWVAYAPFKVLRAKLPDLLAVHPVAEPRPSDRHPARERDGWRWTDLPADFMAAVEPAAGTPPEYRPWSALCFSSADNAYAALLASLLAEARARAPKG